MDPQQEEKSRSQVKREFLELKKLGIQLAGLTRGQLRAIPLSEATRDAVLTAKGLTRSALQRQYRHLASLLAEEEDVDVIRAALAGELQPHIEAVAALHEAEDWRDRLLSGDESQLTAFVERYSKQYVIGNITDSNLRDIWHSLEYTAFRQKVQEFDFSPCTVCGGCDLSESNEEDCYGYQQEDM